MATRQKTVLVTGASKGVGRGIAIGMAKAGYTVGVNYHRDKAGAEETAKTIRDSGGTCWIVPGDIGYADQVSGMFQAFLAAAKRIDVLVNNAGVQTWSPLLDLREEDWDRTIRTNLKGMFLCTQQAARIMKDQPRGQSGDPIRGCIVNIGSGANKAPFPNLIDYCASKGGIETFTTVAAVELGPLGIRVNCVAPGCIEIERTREEDPNYAGTWAPLTPLRRIGQVKDVADAVVYMAGDSASFVTGQTLYVDGALWSQIPWPYETKATGSTGA